jgi:hypothetical protein
MLSSAVRRVSVQVPRSPKKRIQETLRLIRNCSSTRRKKYADQLKDFRRRSGGGIVGYGSPGMGSRFSGSGFEVFGQSSGGFGSHLEDSASLWYWSCGIALSFQTEHPQSLLSLRDGGIIHGCARVSAPSQPLVHYARICRGWSLFISIHFVKIFWSNRVTLG